MVTGEAEARIKAQIWRAVAESDLDLSALDDQTRSALVDLATLAALDAVDRELGTFLNENQEKLQALSDDAVVEMEGDEQILWQGRPFMSVAVRYLITDQRIHVARGLLGRDFQNVDLVRIQDIDHRQSFGNRMVNRGDIEIRSHDPAAPVIVLENISDPDEVYEILRRAVRKARQDQGLTFQEEM
jgi:hypothetical protein